MKQELLKTLAYNFNNARALMYTAESLPLPLMHRLIAGSQNYFPEKEERDAVILAAKKLLQKDAEDFSLNIYPESVYLPEQVMNHFPRLIWLLTDGARSSLRRRQKQTKVFSRFADDRNQFPDYYQRNFHHQTDGYLSESSAALYDHQVELLFKGMAEPMRRRLISPMRECFSRESEIKILEIGCGTGSFTRTLIKTFPKAQITSIDLSPSYIRTAKKRFLKYKNVHFMTADAQDLPFKDNQFDAVVSVFLHHELPFEVRKDVIEESFRVLNPQGFWGILDSLQLGDTPKLDWALNEFPKTFHEPFYKNYIGTPLTELSQSALNCPGEIQERHHFFSKVVYYQGRKLK